MIDAVDFVPLLGLPYESPQVTQLLSRLPQHTARKPSGYDQYIVSKAGGFDLLFSDRNDKAGGRWHRVLTTIFLYNEGADGHRRFPGALPFGLQTSTPFAMSFTCVSGMRPGYFSKSATGSQPPRRTQKMSASNATAAGSVCVASVSKSVPSGEG